ncbi:unnamed protein product, partial [Meganyctiphanes norvegica]
MEISLLVCVTDVTYYCCQNFSTPNLVYRSRRAPGKIPAISALQSTSYSSLWKDYLPAFPSENIILFMQDALSIEDLTSFPHENAELKNLVSESHSVYLPSVGETSSLLRDFKNEGYNITEVSKLQSGINLKSDKNVVLVNLPDTLTIPQRKLAMQKSNEVIESVLSKIGGLRKFTCIYTARKSSKETSEVGSNSKRRVTRSLQQAVDRPAGFHNHSCALIWLRNDVTVNVLGPSGVIDSTFTIPNNKSVASADTGHCEDGVSSSVQITYRNVENIPGATGPYEVRLEFKFIFVRSKWTLSYVEGNLDASMSRDLVFQMHKRKNELVPNKMSYSCSVKRILTSSNKTSSGGTMQMVLNGFQYEAFPSQLSKGKFDGSWDCVGFFTIPVWMSLITIFIFLIILFWGLWMLSDVKTMDRFDDPKGKTINVPNTE